MRRSSSAGSGRAWPTSSAIRASIPRRSSPTSPAGSARSRSPGIRSRSSTAANSSSAISPKSAMTIAPLPATWDVTHRQWRAYGVTGATSGLCDGCHSVNYDIERKTVTEWNVGCERCHGPGSDHVARPARDEHRQSRAARPGGGGGRVRPVPFGRPSARPIDGREFHWPVGFRVGLRLADFWRLESTRSARRSTLHFPDGSGPREPDAGKRLRAEPDVHARRDLRELPRSARDAEQRRPHQAARDGVPDLPWAEIAERSAYRDDRAAHPSSAGLGRQRVRQLPHAEDCA